MNKKFLLSLFALLPIFGYSQQNNIVDEVIWIVGDEPILRSQIEIQRLSMEMQNIPITGDPYCVIPEQLAIQKLFMNQAKIDSITVPDSRLFQEADRYISADVSRFGSKEKMEEYYGKSTSQIREETVDALRERSIVSEMQRHLTKDIKITPTEIRKYFNQLPADEIPYIPTQVEVQVLTLKPKIPQSEIDYIKDRLRDFTEQVHSGRNEFSTLAVVYSDDKASAAVGGELGFKGKGEYVPEFSAVAFSLNDPKRVSKIVETEFGYHIIQLIEKRGDRANFRHILLMPKLESSTLKATAERLDSIRQDIMIGKFSFENAVQHLSEDKNTNKNYGLMVNQNTESQSYGTTRFMMSDLPQEIARVVDTMTVGSISMPITMIDPQTNKEVVVLAKLKARIQGHKANLADDYPILKMIVEGKEREKIIDNFIREKQASTYVRIKEEWRNCEFQYSGWVK